MPPRLKKFLQTFFAFSIAAVLMFWAFRGVSLGDLWDSLQGVNYLWIAAVVPISILSHWLRAVRWSYLLSPVKQHISSRSLFSAVMIGFMVNNVLPRVGEFTRAFAIGRSEGISKSSAFGTIVVERILDMVTFLFVLCLVLFLSPHSLDPFFDNVEAVRPLFFVGSILFLGVFVLLFFKGESLFRLLTFLKHIVPKRFESQYQTLVDSFLTGFAVTKMPAKLLRIVILSLLIYFFYALGLYVSFFAFTSLAGHSLDFGASVILLTISTVAFALPAPGALGTYHFFLTKALTISYHVDPVIALSYSIVTHELGYILTTVVGLYYFIKDHIRVSDVVNVADDSKAV